MNRLVFIMLLATALTGCATVEGVGEDISDGARRASGWF